MAEKVLPQADRVEEEVMSSIPLCSVAQLLKICELMNLTVPEGNEGNKRELVKLVMRMLCTTTADDDKMTEFLVIHDFLWPNKNEEEDGKAEVKAEPAVVEVKGTEQEITATKKTSKPTTSETRSESRERAEVHTAITKVRIKEFKLPGMIGGEGENALTYDSLLFEVNNGRKLGYTDTEMCATIISKTADKETRTYFQTTPDIKLQDVLEMLKSVCCTEKESSNLFTKFTNDKKGKDETPLTFITRVLRLRRKVYTLGEEEGSNYDQNMLARRSLQVIFGGLRDENIRSALRERVKYDHTLEDKVIHKHASDIIVAEEERKLKLFGKSPEVTVQQVTRVNSNNNEGSVTKKEKANPFEKIEELRVENEKRCNELRCELNEIKNLIIAKNRSEDDEVKNQAAKAKAGRARGFGRCKQCVTDNKFRCFHCWDCGQDGHKKGEDECPGNQ